MPYSLIEQILSEGSFECLGPGRSTERLLLELLAMKQKILLYQARQEFKILPEISTLLNFSYALLTDHTKALRQEWELNEKLEQAFFEYLFEPICGHIINVIYDIDKSIMQVLDELFSNLITFATLQLPSRRLYFYSLINTIIKKSAVFHKKYVRDDFIYRYPFGELLEPSESVKKWVDGLEKGTIVDCLKTFAGKSNWSRGVVELIDPITLTVRFLDDFHETYQVCNRYFEIAPLGSHESDYKWREELKVGDLVDFCDDYESQDWALYRILKITEEKDMFDESVRYVEIQRVPQQSSPVGITYDQNIANPHHLEFDSLYEAHLASSLNNINNGATTNYHTAQTHFSEMEHNNNQSYTNDNIDSDMTVPIQRGIYLGSLEKPGEYSSRNGMKIDDTIDRIFLEKQKTQKYAILPPISTRGSRSIYLAKYINIFGANGGFDFIMAVLEGKVKVCNNIMGQLIKTILNTSENLVQPFIRENAAKILNSVINYIMEAAEKNLGDLTKANLLNAIKCITGLLHRIYSYKQTEAISHVVIVKLSILCLKSDIFEKQIFGADQLFDLYDDTRGFRLDIPRNFVLESFIKENIFGKIVEGHPKIVEKGSVILKALVSDNKITDSQFAEIWRRICNTDTDTRSTLLTMIKTVQSEFSKEQIQSFVGRMLESPDEITFEAFDLLTNLRYHCLKKYNDSEVLDSVNGVLSKILQSKREIKQQPSKETLLDFVTFLESERDETFIVQMVENFLNNKNKQHHLKLLDYVMNYSQLSNDLVLQIMKERQFVDHCVEETVMILRSKARSNSAHVDHLNLNIQESQHVLHIDQDMNQVDPMTADEKLQVKFRLKLFKDIAYNASNEQTLFSFSHFHKIWEIVFSSARNEKFIRSFIRRYILSDKTSEAVSHLKDLFAKNYKKLFHPHKDNFLKFFVMMFYNINAHEGGFTTKQNIFKATNIIDWGSKKKNINFLNKRTEELFGIDALWELFIESTSHPLYSELAHYLIKIYLPPEFFDSVNVDLYAKEKRKLVDKALGLFMANDHLKAIKSSLILAYIIKLEERRGSAPLHSLSSLKEGERILLKIKKNHKYHEDKFKVSIFENQTVSELKEIVYEQYGVSPSLILFARAKNEKIKSRENTLTIENANIRTGDSLVVHEVKFPEVMEVGLLNEQGTDFSEHVFLVFEEIFEDYSKDGKMNRENFTNFVLNGAVLKMNHHIDQAYDYAHQKFSYIDKRAKGYLSKVDFMDSYRSRAISGKDGSQSIKEMLQSLGYGKDLKLKRGSSGSLPHYHSLLRYELCKNERFGAQLWKYIEESREAVSSNIKSENKANTNDNNSKMVQELYKFIELLTPSTSRIRSMLEDPIKLLSSDKHPNLWKYDLILLHALVFRKEESHKLLKALDIQYEDAQYQALLSKVVHQEFIEALLDSIRSLQRGYPHNFSNYEHMLSGLRIVEKLFKVAVSTVDLEMVNDMKNFLSDFIKQKKKVSEKVQTESATKKDKGDDIDKFRKIFNDRGKKKKDQNSIEEEQIKQLRSALENSQLLPSLLQNLDFKSLNFFLIDLLKSLNDIKTDLSRYPQVVMKASMIIFIASIKLNYQQLSIILKVEQFQRLILAGLTHENQLIRLYYKNFYAFLTSSGNKMQTKIELLKILISSITNNTNEDSADSLIKLACKCLKAMIEEMKASGQSQPGILHSEFNFVELFEIFSSKLLSHTSTEVEYDESEDSLLIGYLTFMDKILKADEYVMDQLETGKKKSLIRFLFKECLFEIGTTGFVFKNIKCKSKKSRAASLNLLVQLLRDDADNMIDLVVYGLLSLSKSLPDLVSQPYALTSDYDGKNNFGFLGIKNLGCMSYMTAILQQLYCTPAFRHGLMIAADEKTPLMTEVTGRQIDHNLFHQIVKMFSYLDFSKRTYYNPLEFFLAYKNCSHKPIKVKIEQDANEFLNFILGKIRDAIKKGPIIDILNSVYSGKFCNVIVCKGCGFEKIDEEDFNSLSLNVKNFSNLFESLEKFFEEKIISEYMCDKCNHKCASSKKVWLKSLPNVLIVGLKRMVLDLDLLSKLKIHSKFEFPMDINLRKYMCFSTLEKKPATDEDSSAIKTQNANLETLPKQLRTTENETDLINPCKPNNNDDAEYEYKLVGVVVHNGSAKEGHYTSLINVNRNDPRREHIGKDLWLQFDDSRVSRFDMSHFQKECFGTVEDKDEDDRADIESIKSKISKSAYILVYEKVKKSPMIFPFTPETLNQREKIISCLRDPSAVEIGPDFLKTHFYNLKQTLPDLFSQEIQSDNSALVLEQQLLSSSFTNSLAEMFSNIDLAISIDPSKPNDDSLTLKKTLAEAMLQTLPNFLLKVYCISNDNYRIGKIVKAIDSALGFLTFAKFIGNNKQVMHAVEQKILHFYIENVYNNIKPILNALINSSDQFVKNALTDFVVSVFGTIVKNFNIQQFDVDPSVEIDSSTPFKTVAQVYLIKIINILFTFVPNADVNPIQFRKLGQIFIVLQKLTEQNFAVRTIILQENALNNLFNLYNAIDCSKIAQVEKALSPILSIIHMLLIQLQTMIKMQNESQLQLENYFKFFVRIDFFAKILKEDYVFNNFEVLKGLINTVAFENKTISDQITNLCLKNLLSSNEVELLGYLEAIRALLNLKDSLVDYRVKTIFGVPRLIDQSFTVERHKKSFLFGLSKESSLKKAVYSYTTNFGMDCGALDILFHAKNTNDMASMLSIYYIIDLAIEFPHVLRYLAYIQPPSYLTATYYDWFKAYCDHHLKYIANMNSTYKSEIPMVYLHSLPEKFSAFESKLMSYIQSENKNLKENQRLFAVEGNIYSNYERCVPIKKRDPNEHFELFSFDKNYIIGRTNRIKLLETFKLDEDEFGELKMKVHFINVALIESRPTGSTNLSIPQNCLTYENYVNKSAIGNPEIIRFLGANDDVTFDEQESPENTDLEPILIDEESNKKSTNIPKEHHKSSERKNVKLEDSDLFINKDYILRISMSNKTNENYFVKVSISGDEHSAFDKDSFIIPVSCRKSNFLVQNVTLKDLNGSFKGLKVTASCKKSDNISMRNYSDEDFSEDIEVFTFGDK